MKHDVDAVLPLHKGKRRANICMKVLLFCVLLLLATGVGCKKAKKPTWKELLLMTEIQLKKSCDDGFLEACSKLGGKLLLKAESSKDPKPRKEAYRVLKLACDRGRTKDCYRAGISMMLKSPKKRDEAKRLLLKACNGGKATACSVLGSILIGIEGKKEEGFKLLKRACKMGNTKACSLTHSDPECRGKKQCVKFGRCTFKDGECKIGSTADCRQSENCKQSAECTAVLMGKYSKHPFYMCRPRSADDCKQSTDCKEKGVCFFFDNGCIKRVAHGGLVGSPECVKKKDCKKLGYCTYKYRKGKFSCYVGVDSDCKQSNLCKRIGWCKAVPFTQGSELLTCRAVTDADCSLSKVCKDKGKCKAIDGWCRNSNSKSFSRERRKTIKRLRTLMYKLARACENGDKSHTINMLRGGGLSKAIAQMAWSQPNILNKKWKSYVVKAWLKAFKAWRYLEDEIKNSKDIFGSKCYRILKEAKSKASKGCLESGEIQRTKWIKKVGRTECK